MSGSVFMLSHKSFTFQHTKKLRNHHFLTCLPFSFSNIRFAEFCWQSTLNKLSRPKVSWFSVSQRFFADSPNLSRTQRIWTRTFCFHISRELQFLKIFTSHEIGNRHLSTSVLLNVLGAKIYVYCILLKVMLSKKVDFLLPKSYIYIIKDGKIIDRIWIIKENHHFKF